MDMIGGPLAFPLTAKETYGTASVVVEVVTNTGSFRSGKSAILSRDINEGISGTRRSSYDGKGSV